MLPEGLEGWCDPRFVAVADVVARDLATGAHHGAAVAVFHRGEPVVDIWGGRRGLTGAEERWEADTMAYSFSTTKSITATALHMALERNGIDYDTPVAALWPEFGRNGKDNVTIRHALCHEAGIPQIRGEVPDVSVMADWDEMVRVIEGLAPLWEPGTQNGYHALTFGWIIGELVRRIDGRPLPTFVAEEIAGPLELDGFYVATPPDVHHRVTPVVSPIEFAGISNLDAILGDSLLLRALTPEGDFLGFVNSPLGLGACVPSISGQFTARSLAAFYAVLERGGTNRGVTLLRPETVAAATTVQNKRPDLVLFVPIYWRLGFMSGGSGISPAGPNREAFGHSGFGGSIAIADPRAEISVAVVLDRLEINLLGDERGRGVVQAAIDSVAAIA